MPKTKLTINAKTLFPITELKTRLKEAFTVSDTLGPAIITKNNRPAYAIVRIDNRNRDINQILSEQIDLARSAAKGNITTEQYWWERE